MIISAVSVMIENSKFKFFRPNRWVGRLLLAGLLVGYLSYTVLFQQNETQSIADVKRENLLDFGEYHEAVVAATARLANKYHYRKKELTNDFSEQILFEYLESLDPQKVYFLSSDVRDFESNRFYFDNFLKRGKLDEIFSIFRVYQQRVNERADYAISKIDYPFDFELNEDIQINRSDEDWPISEVEQNALWDSLIKESILTLRLNGEDETRIKETMASRYDRIRNSVAMSNAFDVIEIFLNSYLKELDPHSQFFSPHSSSNLRISISQQIEGIGAMLRTENEYTVVQGVITGGPAHLSKRLHIGDRIVGVSNGGDEEFQDIVGWRIEDVVDLIRGPKGTTVNLKVLRKDAPRGTPADHVVLVRQTVKLEEQMAKKSTVEIDSDGEIFQLGVIQLPSFYSSFLETDDSDLVTTSSADDVKEFLIEFEEQQIDGLVVDLRGNGGGALNEAVELTSMFIPSGPVVQVENSQKELRIHADSDGQTVYDGPLVVLVDRHSASASEIFSAAMQDYGRAIVVGETTFGKGSLQNIWPLGQLAKEKNVDLGALKLSTAQFFRVNGISTQHLGVIPDVLFPTNELIANSGERSFENALPESAIKPTRHTKHWHKKIEIQNKIPEIRELNRIRMELNPLMKIIVEQDRMAFHRETPTIVSLNENLRKQSLESDQDEQLGLLNEVRSLFGLDPVDTVTDDAYPSDRIGDIFLDEAINILADLVSLQNADNRS